MYILYKSYTIVKTPLTCKAADPPLSKSSLEKAALAWLICGYHGALPGRDRLLALKDKTLLLREEI